MLAKTIISKRDFPTEFYKSLLYIHYEVFIQVQVSSESGLVGACLRQQDDIMARALWRFMHLGHLHLYKYKQLNITDALSQVQL